MVPKLASHIDRYVAKSDLVAFLAQKAIEAQSNALDLLKSIIEEVSICHLFQVLRIPDRRVNSARIGKELNPMIALNGFEVVMISLEHFKRNAIGEGFAGRAVDQVLTHETLKTVNHGVSLKIFSIASNNCFTRPVYLFPARAPA